jgi:hypothetical protein
MSQFKLFRQEALKNQYKSAEFGESVISQPDWLHVWFGWLLVLVILSLTLAAIVPIQSQQQVRLTLLHSHFQPLVSADPVVVEQHLVTSGTLVDVGQPVAQLRRLTSAQPEGQLFSLLSASRGEYFAEAAVGSTLPALQPVGRILRPETTSVFQFALAQHVDQLRVGQVVTLAFGTERLSGQLISISPHQNESRVVGVRLDQDLDRSQLAPGSEFVLQLRLQRKNIFSLLE